MKFPQQELVKNLITIIPHFSGKMLTINRQLNVLINLYLKM